MLTQIQRITCDQLSRPRRFEVVLADDDGAHRSLFVNARELLTYSGFCLAVLAELGVMFGNERYECRSGAAIWRSDVDDLLSAKQTHSAVSEVACG